MAVLEQLKLWTSSVLQSRQHVPFGSPLWAYKITDHELESLQTVLQRLFSTTNANLLFNRYLSYLSRPLVLYIATWLQRNTKSRPTWGPVTSSICLEYNTSSRALIVDCIRAGLKEFGIKIHHTQNDRYLDTLYCHGGFPRADLLGISHSHLMGYFEDVLNSYATFLHSITVDEIAERKLSSLPETLQQKSFSKLASSLISYLFELRDNFHLYETSDPLAFLDLKNPNWRNNIPFLVIDEEASRLINTLLNKTSKVVRRAQNPVRLKRYLRQNADEFNLFSEVHVNHTIHPEDLNKVLGVHSLPNFFELITITGDGHRSRAASFSYKTGVAPRWIVSEIVRPIVGLLAAGELKYQLYSDGELIGSNMYRHGESFDDRAPWIFEADEQNFNYLGQGSFRDRLASVLVVSNSEPAKCSPSSQVRLLGKISFCERSVYKITGHVKIPSTFGHFHIRTDASQLNLDCVNVKGKKLVDVISDKPVYIGKPNIVIDESKPDASLNKEEFFWVSTNGTRIPYFSNTVTSGTGAVVRVLEGEIVWVHECVYLHDEFLAELIHNGKGEFEVKFRGLENANVGLVPGQSAILTSEPELIAGFKFCDIRLTDLLVDSVEFSISWSDTPDNTIRLRLPIALNAVSLLTKTGDVYRECDFGFLTADDLIDCTFKFQPGTSDTRVKVDLLTDEKIVMSVSQEMNLSASGGSKTLPARAIANLVRRLFRNGSTPEHVVRLSFYAENEILESRIPLVYRFKYLPEIRNRFVYLRKTLLLIKHFDQLKLKLTPIWDLKRNTPDLEFVFEDGDFVKAKLPEIDEYGGWLLWGPGQTNFKPTLIEFDVPVARKKIDNLGAFGQALKSALQCSQGTTDFDEPLKQDSIQHAVKYQKQEGNKRTINFSPLDRILERMENDVDHEGWSYFNDLIDLVEEIEPANFHALKRLLSRPSCLTLMLLRDTSRFHKVWELADYLPFEWSLIPISAWIKAIDKVKQKNASSLELIKKTAPTIYAEVERGLFSNLTAKGPYFNTLVDIALVNFTPSKKIWADTRDSKDSGSFIGNQFLIARSKLFERHQHKLMSISQSKKRDIELIECLDSCWPVSSLPSDLRGFFKAMGASEQSEVVKRAHKLTIELPVKVAFYNLDIFLQPLPTWAFNALSFSLSQLQQFDREWLQDSMSLASGAAYSAFCNSEFTVVG